MNTTYRIFKSILTLFLMLGLFLSSAVTVSPVSAATIIVTTTEDENEDNSLCSLREAIASANDDDGYGGCQEGSGNDIIILPEGIYTLTNSIQVTSEIVFDGEDANSTIIQASTCNPITLPEGCSPATQPIFFVSSTGNFSLNRVTLRHGNRDLYFGGAVVNQGTLEINDSIITANQASSGGAISNETASATLNMNNSVLSGNKASAESGGGIYNEGSITLTESEVTNNYAEEWAGGIYQGPSSMLTINKSTIANNTANTGYGGGIVNYGNVFMINSTISGNSSSMDGGGIFNAGNLEISSSTFSGNVAGGVGGGIYLGGVDALDLSNTIIANSTNYDCYSSEGSAGIGDNTHNLIEDNGPTGKDCGTPSLSVDPSLDDLGDYGGPTMTHKLKKGSLAINAGNPKDYPATDQRGMVRPQEGAPDIGAFEFRLENLVPQFTSRAKRAATVGELYTYNITAEDKDGDKLWITALTIPDWLSFVDRGNGQATLSGTPEEIDIGNHDVTLMVEDVENGFDIQDFDITVAIPPTADFSVSPDNGQAPLDVIFTNLSTGGYTSCNWDFGDGTNSTICIDPQHTYQTAGQYSVSLTVNGAWGMDIETKTDYIDVNPAPGPVSAEFSGTPRSGQVPLEVTFTNQSVGDYDTCSWDFGDGGTSNDCNPDPYTYQTAGLYTVILTVSGTGGEDTLTEADYISVSTEPVPLVADFSAVPTSGQAPLEVTFTNQTTGIYSNCVWDFGDGYDSTLCSNFKHTYLEAGIYTVSLTVDDGSGATDEIIKTDYITVFGEGETLIFLPLILH